MKFYMMIQEKQPGCGLGYFDVVLYDKHYEDWCAVQHGYFPWYANATKQGPRQKLPNGMVLVGKSKKYTVAVRQIARNLYAINRQFFQACEETGVAFLDLEPVDFKAQGGAIDNPLSYHAASFMKYPTATVVVEGSKLTIGEYGRIEGFSELQLNDVGNAVFRIEGFSASIDTLFCTEDFKVRAEALKVRGIAFVSLEGNDSDALHLDVPPSPFRVPLCI
ncbi:hypothetical protein [Pseudomonas sp. NPDC089401]|uniref:hypothetical protein n=1 Tax=Pseudomonas sp. NPDC089401 TaxID=3364462 RepID=UPI00380FC939